MAYRLRHIQERIALAAKYFKVVLITGARQTGKTTLLKNLYPDIPIVTFDKHRDLHNATSNPDLFLKTHPSPLILDEIQYVPELLSTIKRVVDQSDAPGQYFLTGSHNMGMMKVAAESMAGRVAIIDLDHLTPFEEAETFTFHAGHPKPITWLEQYLTDPLSLVKNYKGTTGLRSPVHAIWRGCFPHLLECPDVIVGEYLDAYVRAYIERDAVYADPSAVRPEFRQFLHMMSILSGKNLKEETLSKALGVSSEIIKKWRYALIQTHQWRELSPYDRNGLKRTAKSTKGYMTDTGLACYLQGISNPLTLLGTDEWGSLFETYCVNLVMKLVGSLLTRPTVYYWQIVGGGEVDIVLLIDNKLYPIEIKASSSLSGHDARGITAFKEALKDKPGPVVQPGLILYAGDVCYALREDVVALPFDAVMR